MRPNYGFAKLWGASLEYFVQRLCITIGRRTGTHNIVDVDLGTMSKKVSRTHARLQFNFSLRCFELLVMGRHGVTVNGTFYSKGEKVPLKSPSEIGVGNISFYFLLPEDALNPSIHPKPVSTGDRKRKRDERQPTESYAQLILEALSSKESKTMSLKELYSWIEDHYEFYRNAGISWKSSVRHNCNHYPAFRRIEVQQDGSSTQKKKPTPLFTFVPEYRDAIVSGVPLRKVRRLVEGNRTGAPAVEKEHLSDDDMRIVSDEDEAPLASSS